MEQGFPLFRVNRKSGKRSEVSERKWEENMIFMVAAYDFLYFIIRVKR